MSETLTDVSVEASKQRNKREEKNQSTRQITPVQKPETRPSEQLQGAQDAGVSTLDTFLQVLKMDPAAVTECFQPGRVLS